MQSENFEIRAVIKFLIKEGNSVKQIYERLKNVYKDAAPAYSTVAKWSAEFIRGWESLEDDPRFGRPSAVIIIEKPQEVEKSVEGDRRINVSEIERELGVSAGSIFTVLHVKY